MSHNTVTSGEMFSFMVGYVFVIYNLLDSGTGQRLRSVRVCHQLCHIVFLYPFIPSVLVLDVTVMTGVGGLGCLRGGQLLPIVSITHP